MSRKCPNPETLAAMFSGDLSQKKKSKLIRHVFQCAACRVRFEALRNIRLQMEEKVNRLPSRPLTEEESRRLKQSARERLSGMGAGLAIPKPRLLGRFRYAYIGAAVLLVAGLSTAIFSGKIFSNRTRSRSSNQETFRLLEPVGRISSPPQRFSWTPFADADVYKIRIIEEDLRLLLKMNVLAPTQAYQPSESLIAGLQRGKTYVWSIEALNEDGEKIAFAQDYFRIK